MTQSEVIRSENITFDEPLVQNYLDAIPEPFEGFDINKFCGDIRSKLMEKAKEKTGGNKSAAAKLLGISPQAVHQYFKEKDG